MILNGVIRPARQHLRHISPLIPQSRMRQEQYPLLIWRPLHLQDTRIEVVMPTLSALLTEAAWDEFGDEGPALGSVLLDEFPHEVVLVVAPGLLFQEFRLVGLLLVGGFVVAGWGRWAGLAWLRLALLFPPHLNIKLKRII